MKSVNEGKFLNRVAADLLDRFGNELQDVAVVFNNKRPQLYLKKYLAEVSGKPIWSPQMYTIQEFLSLGTTLVPAGQLKQFFVLYTCYNELLKSEGKDSVSPDEFYPLAEIILGDFSQVDYYLANANEIFGLIEDIAELQLQFPNFDEDQLQFMRTFWGSFSAKKQNQMQERFIELWQRMPALYVNFHARLAKEDLVTNARMYRNLAEGKDSDPSFLKTFKHTVFVGFNALSRAEEKFFKQWQEKEWCSFYFDVDAHYFSNPLQEAGHFIRRNIHTVGLVNQFQEAPARLNDKAKEFFVVQALGNVAQGKLLSELLDQKDTKNEGGKAIILADEKLLIPALQTIDDDSVNVTMGYPFEQSALYGLCDLWLSIQEALLSDDEVNYKHVLSFLFNPLITIDADLRNKMHNQVVDEKKITFNKTELLHTGKIAGITFNHFIDSFTSIRHLASVLLYVAEEGKLQRMDSLLSTEAVKALNALTDSFEELKAEGAKDFNPRFVFKLIRRALQGLTVPFEGEPLAGLQVMGLLESRNLDFDELIVLGVNEGILPKINNTPSFIPDNIRRAFGLPILEHQNAISAYLFYRLLHVAKKITLVYNGVTDEKSTGEESRFIKQLEFETNCTFINRVQQNQAIENPRELKIVVEKNGDVLKGLEKYFKRNSTAKYDKKISATAFTDYNTCSLRFFYKNIAGLKEPKDLPDRIEANLIGSALHTVMEVFYEPVTGQEVTADFIKERETRLSDLCEFALAKELKLNAAKTGTQTPALQQIVLQVLEQYALKILRNDEKLTPFKIEELENKSDYVMLYPIEVGSKSQNIWLYGIIDRVDVKDGKIRIVDYKTGKDQLKYKDFPSLFEDQAKDHNKALIQTLFYTYVYEQVKKRQYVEPHLYTVRDFKEGTLFKEKHKGGLLLQDQSLEAFKSMFADKLREKLEELFDENIPFVQTENKENCGYCPYKDICQR
ncbi:ATP-dependent nuclease subunit B [Pedobacter ginsengisoli]|uniref:ATP-dependent nuclease subunit B n=1 Tax=Pedobacter ginsengisoli TaxID=363852 RepID=A0A2D1U9E4_9SPHI|nr:PD-(D/E)XK nuclease family protein [Pedobacter ginsengisoli]ATP58200.1 ATP-dependent nuclease subunit B [Pedobacter ginsengisoli]